MGRASSGELLLVTEWNVNPMKTRLWTLLLLLQLGTVSSQNGVADSTHSPAPDAANEKRAFTLTERGPHHRTWERVEVELAPDGTPVEKRRSYQELATGLHFKNERGEWEETQEQIEILPNNAGAVAMKGQHKVIFPLELKSGLIELQMPEGKWLRSRVWGLAYFDAATGESVLLAEVKESEGQLVGDNVVLYPNAFTDFLADVRYTYTKAGFEQDVVLREQPPTPEELGLNSKTTRLQVLTEFIEPDQPNKVRGQAGGIPDETLGFGVMNIGGGKAFGIGAQGEVVGRVPVAKQWGQLEGRDFLVEEAAYDRVAGQLQKLPSAKKYQGANLQRRGKGENVLAGLQRLLPNRYAKTDSKPVDKPKRMARASYEPTSGLVMDYLVTLANGTNQRFKADTTYYVNGLTYLNGLTTFEGGAVIKYAVTNNACIVTSDTVWPTGRYAPVLFTSINDNTVGVTIPGSTGNPTTNVAGIVALDLNSAENSRVQNARFTYLERAVAGYAVTYEDVQFLFCHIGHSGEDFGSSHPTLRNVLIYQVNTFIEGGNAGNFVQMENVTVRQVPVFQEDSTSTVLLTNCLFVCVTNWQTLNVITNSSVFLNSDAGVFASVGAGAHYLAAGSPYRNVGSTNLEADLLTGLRKKTTYAPVILTNTITTDTILSPQVQRDTDIPDLGYHYDPIDYFVSCQVTNTTLTLTNGVVIGYYDTIGFWLHNDARLISTGSPTGRNQFVYYTLVQELPVTLAANSPGSSLPFNPWHSDAARHPEVQLRFTTLRTVQNATYLLYAGSGDWDLKRLEVRDCEFYGPNAAVYVYFYGNVTNASLHFINNLFAVPTFSAQTEAGVSGDFVVRNNLFLETSVDIWNWEASAWTAKDNAFNGGSVFLDGDIGHNAYLNGSTVYSDIQTNDLVVTNFLWTPGPLGNYYQLSTNLLNQGSQTAALAGLYHHTVVTNRSNGLQIKETNSIVDIGYHYVAVDGNGKPIDTDGDGLPDYLEDTNGDGNYNTGDLANWNAADTDGDGINDSLEILLGRNPRVAGSVADTGNQTKLQVFTPLK